MHHFADNKVIDSAGADGRQAEGQAERSLHRVVRCHRPWTGFELFDHVGDVRPCCWGKVSCGNVNDTSPESIWNGPGFRFYREKMAEGDLGAICKSDCPILQGLYDEVLPQDIHKPLPLVSGKPAVAPDGPRYLRVVPTTNCNLSCPMCYQLNDPPARLPPDLFGHLEAWLATAYELLILGGEPFVSRACLEWIERLVPDRFPKLGLAAITNGLGFTEPVCRLVASRSWHWILVSIDAATPAVYSAVRGGDFGQLKAGLDRLARVRSGHAAKFELRFGFTVQNSNLRDVLPFLDLCDEYDALPQYTTVFGDWHDEGPSTIERERRFLATLEHLDSELAARGFGKRLLAGAVARLLESPRTPNVTSPWARLIYADDSASGRIQLARGLNRSRSLDSPQIAVVDRGLLADSFVASLLRSQAALGNYTVISSKDSLPAEFTETGEIALSLVPGASRDEARQACEKAVRLSDERQSGALFIEVSQALKKHWATVRGQLRRINVSCYSVSVPYQEGGRPTGAAEWRNLVIEINAACDRQGWRRLGGRPDPRLLGLAVENQYPDVTQVFGQLGAGKKAISIVSAIYNRACTLPYFLTSLESQAPPFPFEVILIDDGSTDESLRVALQWCERVAPRIDCSLLSLSRQTPYRYGTFSFRAGAARQKGIERATGERILFLDPDQRIHGGCVEQHDWWGRLGFDVVIGERRQQAGPERNHLELGWPHSQSELKWTQGMDWWLYFYTGNASVSRDRLNAVGGFDETLQYWGLDDTDLGYRLAQSGARMWRSVRAVVTHLDVPSGGGRTIAERAQAHRLHREVLYRKYLDDRILDAYAFADVSRSDVSGALEHL